MGSCFHLRLQHYGLRLLLHTESVNMKLVECVPNFSNGRDRSIVESIVHSIESAGQVRILNVEMDANHNRSVVSFAAPPDSALEAAFAGIKTAADLIDMTKHTGEHPRFGAADVIPFIPLSDSTLAECSELAHRLGKRVGEELGIPVYMYGEAAVSETRKNLEDIRNKNFQYEQLRESINAPRWKPDYGPASVGRQGASIIGSRDFLVAYNVNLNTQDLATGKKIAKALRARDGGLTFVKALAFYLEDKKCVQISMNLTNYRKTPIYRAFEMVSLEASRYGLVPFESEVVGLVPMEALEETAKFYLRLNGFSTEQILENKLFQGVHGKEDDFMERLASASPTPGGGSASAHVGAIAAALDSMVASLTVGKKKYAEYQEEMTHIAERSREILSTLTRYSVEDEEAFAQLAAVWKMPKNTDEEIRARDAAMAEALNRNIESPWNIARASYEVIELAEKLVRYGNRNAITDAACATLFGLGAVKGALLNVLINLKSVKNKAQVEQEKIKIKLFIEQAQAVHDRTMKIINGELW